MVAPWFKASVAAVWRSEWGEIGRRLCVSGLRSRARPACCRCVPHHGLNGPDAQGPTAATLRDILLLRVILPRPPQPAEERMLREQAAKGRGGIRDRMVPLVMDPAIGCEGLEHPGGQHDRLLRRVAAFAMEIENRDGRPAGARCRRCARASSILRVPVLTQSSVMA